VWRRSDGKLLAATAHVAVGAFCHRVAIAVSSCLQSFLVSKYDDPVMAHFQVPNTTYRPEFKALKFRHCLLIELYGGTGQSGAAEKLDVSIKDSSVAKHTELAWNKADHRLFRLEGRKLGKAIMEARAGTTETSPLFCSLEITVEVAQHEFISRLVDGVKLASVRSQNFPVSVMIAQACIESGFQGAQLAPAKRALSRVVVHNTLFGITKPDTPEWSWFSKCKTISSPTVAVAGGPVVSDKFCRASSLQEAVEIYLQLIKENPRTPKLNASTSLPHSSWSEKELTMIAGLMHSELNFGMGVPDYGSDVMNMIKSRNLTVFDYPEL
jgi:Mannosyl-glycoprotein endo-beta-N-acetylglucosaminidase